MTHLNEFDLRYMSLMLADTAKEIRQDYPLQANALTNMAKALMCTQREGLK